MPTWKGPAHPAAADGGPPPPALFVDRDGVVIADRDYLADPDGVALLPGVAAALARARAEGWLLIGVTNQSGIGRGYFGEAEFGAVMERIEAELAAAGARFDAFYYCPHGPADDCPCRKPRPGLLREAARDLTWDPARSWVVGDKASDVALGRDAGLGGVLVRTGYGRGQEEAVRARWGGDDRVFVADDLAAAVDRILAATPGGEA